MSRHAVLSRSPSQVTRSRSRGRWPLALFVAVLAGLWFGFLEMRGLYFPDEGRYAEIPREMLASGDWVTPRLNGFPYFEKPPLQYWATAAVFAIAGEDEWTARTAPAIAGFLALLAVGFTARCLYSRRAGWMAAALLGGSVGYFLANQFVTLDVMLTAMLTGALCAFLLAQRDGVSTAGTRGWMYVAWVMGGLAFLAKGAIALVLPGLAIATYVTVTREWRILTRLHVGVGLLLLAAIIAPWLMLTEIRNPGFLHYFFITEHWQRFTQPTHQRPGAWWYYIPIGAAMLLPWLPAIVRAYVWRDGAVVAAPSQFRPTVFAWCWAMSVLLFFSMSSSKLPSYILPALAGVALAVAPRLARRWRQTTSTTAWTVTMGGAVGLLVAIPLSRGLRPDLLRHAYDKNVIWVLLGMTVLVMAGVLSRLLLRRRRRVASLICLWLGGMLACQIATVTAYHIDAHFSSERIIEGLSEGEAVRPFQPNVPFYSVDFFDHTIPFYLGRTVILVKDRGELAATIDRAPENFIAEIATFAKRWEAGPQAFAIMRISTFDELTALGLPMRVIGEDGRRIIVARY